MLGRRFQKRVEENVVLDLLNQRGHLRCLLGGERQAGGLNNRFSKRFGPGSTSVGLDFASLHPGGLQNRGSERISRLVPLQDRTWWKFLERRRGVLEHSLLCGLAAQLGGSSGRSALWGGGGGVESGRFASGVQVAALLLIHFRGA